MQELFFEHKERTMYIAVAIESLSRMDTFFCPREVFTGSVGINY
jgi:hypothetical protein